MKVAIDYSRKKVFGEISLEDLKDRPSDDKLSDEEYLQTAQKFLHLFLTQPAGIRLHIKNFIEKLEDTNQKLN